MRKTPYLVEQTVQRPFKRPLIHLFKHPFMNMKEQVRSMPCKRILRHWNGFWYNSGTAILPKLIDYAKTWSTLIRTSTNGVTTLIVNANEQMSCSIRSRI